MLSCVGVISTEVIKCAKFYVVSQRKVEHGFLFLGKDLKDKSENRFSQIFNSFVLKTSFSDVHSN